MERGEGQEQEQGKVKGASLVAKQYIVPFILITSLFFMWGFARSILDVLNKHFQDVMDLSKSASSLIQVMTYSAYFLFAIPAGLFINRRGYKGGVVCGLILFAVGSLIFIPGDLMMGESKNVAFALFLAALFVIGCGLVFLETAANPYSANLGDPRTAASRLNLSQSFNGLGCIFGPAILGSILFSETGGSVAIPYAIMGGVVLIVAFIFSRSNLPEIKMDDVPEQADGSVMGVWRNRWFVFGLVALFCYEIAEIAINSFFINYVTDDGWLTPAQASWVLSLGALMLFMAGRVIGSFVMSKVRAEFVLTICGVFTVLGALLVTINVGAVSKCGLFACYIFESIMFPTVFALSLRGLNAYQTKRASSFLMMTPIGGAVGAYLMGTMADYTSMSMSFIVPMLAYGVVLAYAISALKRRGGTAEA